MLVVGRAEHQAKRTHSQSRRVPYRNIDVESSENLVMLFSQL